MFKALFLFMSFCWASDDVRFIPLTEEQIVQMAEKQQITARALTQETQKLLTMISKEEARTLITTYSMITGAHMYHSLSDLWIRNLTPIVLVLSQKYHPFDRD